MRTFFLLSSATFVRWQLPVIVLSSKNFEQNIEKTLCNGTHSPLKCFSIHKKKKIDKKPHKRYVGDSDGPNSEYHSTHPRLTCPPLTQKTKNIQKSDESFSKILNTDVCPNTRSHAEDPRWVVVGRIRSGKSVVFFGSDGRNGRKKGIRERRTERIL